MTLIETKLTAAKTITTAPQDTDTPLTDGYVRLKLAAASLCGTDLHYFNHFANAGFVLQNPVTLGHEACAWVVDANGSDLEEGQLVALNPIMNCQTCPACQRGEENLCSNKKFPARPQPCRISTGSSAARSTTPPVAAAPSPQTSNPNT